MHDDRGEMAGVWVVGRHTVRQHLRQEARCANWHDAVLLAMPYKDALEHHVVGAERPRGGQQPRLLHIRLQAGLPLAIASDRCSRVDLPDV